MTNTRKIYLAMNTGGEAHAMRRSTLPFVFAGVSAVSLITSFSLLAAAVYIH